MRLALLDRVHQSYRKSVLAVVPPLAVRTGARGLMLLRVGPDDVLVRPALDHVDALSLALDAQREGYSPLQTGSQVRMLLRPLGGKSLDVAEGDHEGLTFGPTKE